MKKIKICLFITLLLFIATPKAEALLDIFTVYGKRNNTIEKIILEALNTPKKEWVRTRVPIPEKYESSSTYAPKGLDKRNPSTCVFFEELYLAKHPTLHTLNDLYCDEAMKFPYFSCQVLYQDEKTLSFEICKRSNQIAEREHLVGWIVDLGKGNFRMYTYRTQYENVKEEEKTFWLQLFQYMEEQIKNVPA